MESQLPMFLTVYEAADLLRLKRSTAYELIRQGAIPAIRLGRFIRIPRNSILAMANGRKENQPGGAKPRAVPPPGQGKGGSASYAGAYQERGT